MCLSTFIIKFSYNTRSDRLKQCTLSEYRCTEELSRYRGNMADQFPSFPQGFSLDPDIFFDLENENENELLASVKVADHSFQEPIPNSPLLLSYLSFGACILQESRSTIEEFILGFWLR